MPLTREEYEALLQRSDRGEIVFFYDSVQCKNFLLHLNWATFLADTGKDLRFQCYTIRTIVYAIEPASLMVCMIASFAWLGWWGLLVAPAVFLFWSFLKSVSSGGRLSIAMPILEFAGGIAVTVWFHNQGVGFIVFMLSLSVLYLAEKMLYSLPVLFFSGLTYSCYDLVRLLHENSIDDFNKQIGLPVIWHEETVGGAIPKPQIEMPSQTYLALYGIFSKQCRRMISDTLKESLAEGGANAEKLFMMGDNEKTWTEPRAAFLYVAHVFEESKKGWLSMREIITAYHPALEPAVAKAANPVAFLATAVLGSNIWAIANGNPTFKTRKEQATRIEQWSLFSLLNDFRDVTPWTAADTLAQVRKYEALNASMMELLESTGMSPYGKVATTLLEDILDKATNEFLRPGISERNKVMIKRLAHRFLNVCSESVDFWDGAFSLHEVIPETFPGEDDRCAEPMPDKSKKEAEDDHSDATEPVISLEKRAEDLPGLCRVMMNVIQTILEREYPQVMLLPHWHLFVTTATIATCSAIAMQLHFEVPEQDRTRIELIMRKSMERRYPKSDSIFEDCLRFCSEGLMSIPRPKRDMGYFTLVATWILKAISGNIRTDEEDAIIRRIAVVIRSEARGYWELPKQTETRTRIQSILSSSGIRYYGTVDELQKMRLSPPEKNEPQV